MPQKVMINGEECGRNWKKSKKSGQKINLNAKNAYFNINHMYMRILSIIVFFCNTKFDVYEFARHSHSLMVLHWVHHNALLLILLIYTKRQSTHNISTHVIYNTRQIHTIFICSPKIYSQCREHFG